MQLGRINGQMAMMNNRAATNQQNKSNNPSFGYNLKGLESFIKANPHKVSVEQLMDLKALASDETTKDIAIKVVRCNSDNDYLIGITDARYPMARHQNDSAFIDVVADMGGVKYGSMVEESKLIGNIIAAAKNSKILDFVENVMKPSDVSNRKTLKEFEKLEKLLGSKKFVGKDRTKTRLCNRLDKIMSDYKNSLLDATWDGRRFNNKNYAVNLNQIVDSGLSFSLKNGFMLHLGNTKRNIGSIFNDKIEHPLNMQPKKFAEWLENTKISMQQEKTQATKQKIAQNREKKQKDHLISDLFA